MKINSCSLIIVLSIILFSSCKKTEVIIFPEIHKTPVVVKSHYIGEKFGGGIVFYVYKDSTGTEHGLIASLVDVSIGTVWGPLGIDVINCESRSNGAVNTRSMVDAGCEAAKICVNYSNAGYKDWFLPAVDQLNMLEYAVYNINMVLENDGLNETMPIYFGESSDYYWSSTELNTDMNNNYACGFKYVAAVGPKNKIWRVRAIRSF